MYSELYNKINYTADISFLISRYIREYDIGKANISVLYTQGILNKEQYTYLYNADKMERQVQIGLLQKDNPKATIALKEGIIKAKHDFFQANDIQDHEVLSIKNDAIFVIDRPMVKTEFGLIRFIHKNTYTSFYGLRDKEMYYYFDSINNQEKLDLKGIRPEKLVLHEKYFLEFLKVLFCSAETESIQNTIDVLVTFYNKYLALELDIGYYRRFDSDSNYVLKRISDMYSYRAEFLPETAKKDIDISYNMNIMRALHQVYSGLLFTRK